MFFRVKNTPTSKVLKLLESYRDCEGKPKHRTIVSLGTPTLEKEQLKRVAYLIDKHFYSSEADFIFEMELTDAERTFADETIRKIETEKRWIPTTRGTIEAKQPNKINEIKVDEVEHETTSELGPVLVANKAWNDLQLNLILDSVGMSESRIISSKIAVINRLVDPVSENSLLSWYRSTALADITGMPLKGAGIDRFYRASDDLLTHHKEIESALRKRTAELHSVDRTILLYDLTNTHFEGTCVANENAKRGKNKQKRDDCPQVVVGMIFDQSGFEIGHKMFAGNQSDSQSLPQMIETMLSISTDSECTTPLVIMDSGMSSKENLAILRKKGIRYLVNDRRPSRSKYANEFSEIDQFKVIEKREGKPVVKVRYLEETHFETTEGGSQDKQYQERILLCSSEQRGEKEKAIVSNAETKFIKELEKFKKRVETQKKPVSQQVIENKIGKLQQKHPRIQRYYTIIGKSETREFSWSRIDEKYTAEKELTECYVLRTNAMDIRQDQIWQAYITLTTAEKGFRTLKGDLGLRPNFHHLSDRVDGHIFITILAYILLRHITIQLEHEDDFRSWTTIKRILKTHAYTTVIIPDGVGAVHRIRKAGRPDESQKRIYSILGVEWNRLPQSHIVTKKKVK